MEKGSQAESTGAGGRGYFSPAAYAPSLDLATQTTPRRSRGTVYLKLIVLFLLVALSLLQIRPNRFVEVSSILNEPEPSFDWDSITPSDDIVWTPCFSEYKCARLLLPLDYLSPADVGPKAIIAMQLLPATDKENYKGAILINPGGPGGSGTASLPRLGKNVSTIVGPSYDVLGFDPRGTGATIPSARCFDSESQHKIWDSLDGELLNTTDGSVPLVRARMNLVSQRCVATLGGTGKEEPNGTVEQWGGGRFMSTPSVATDMLRIIEKLGQEKLLYWGGSYGTVLGQYFAAMYPDKVGRVVIDGILDGHGYRDALWDSLVDAEAIRFSFVTFCYKAGRHKCPLYERSEELIAARVIAVTEKLKQEPVSLPFTTTGPHVLQYQDLVAYMFSAAYKPTAAYGTLAQIYLAIEKGNGTALSELYPNFHEGLPCDCTPTQPWRASNEAFAAIACSDAIDYSYSPEGFSAYFSNLTELSPFFAPLWSEIYLRCSEWAIRAKWRYTEPLAATSTFHPLLMISTKYDPVCPLSDARKVHARFPGSGFLLQNSYGHCSASAPSLCTAKYVRAYFENGTIPEEGTVCEVNELPLVGAVGTSEELAAMSVEDREMLDAWRGLMEEMPTGRW